MVFRVTFKFQSTVDYLSIVKVVRLRIKIKLKGKFDLGSWIWITMINVSGIASWLVTSCAYTIQKEENVLRCEWNRDLWWSTENAKKRTPHFIGPYQISSRVGRVAYEIALPPSLLNLYSVFHVSWQSSD